MMKKEGTACAKAEIRTYEIRKWRLRWSETYVRWDRVRKHDI